ncbi:MAG: response regulator [Planctomycetes bacterium]|nr:response regulator [Planctomycetota bacterium]
MNLNPVSILSPVSILITDDDVSWRETLRDVFAPPNFMPFLAGDGEEALTIIRSGTIHVVLLDMHMPRLTGLETVERLKEFNARLPCILMSAEADDRLIDQARRLQVYDVLRKPVSRQRVVASVSDALERAYRESA